MFALLTVFLSTVHCSSSDECGNIAEYFWPLTLGSKYVYEIYSEPKGWHRVYIEYIETTDGETTARTNEIYEFAYGGSHSMKYEYTLKPGGCIITKRQVEPHQGKEIVLLKGPLKTCTRWDTRAFTGLPESSRQKPQEFAEVSLQCTCRAADSTELKDHEDCVEVRCCGESDICTSFFFCRNVGYVGYKAVGDGQEVWIEKMVRE